MNLLFNVRQWIKTILQNVVLPQIYALYRHRAVKKDLVLFADAHNNELPYTMQHMYRSVVAKGYEVKIFCIDFARASLFRTFRFLVSFMKTYAVAGTVFICDYFLPVSSCRKRRETQVVQLWHACGAFKKFGYDAGEDISRAYRGNPMKNCTLVTVSSRLCVPIYAQALHLPENVVRATGISRTDVYFDETYRQSCRERFFARYPRARGRKILLWAPTFRGNAGNPQAEGVEVVAGLGEKLGSQWYVVIKLHPYLERRMKLSNCDMPTEELLTVADVLLTDYSSVLFDFMIMKKPVVLFAPDDRAYLKRRGFYLDYHSIPAVHARNAAELPYAVKSALTEAIDTSAFCAQYVGCCDGKATERIQKIVFGENQRG